MRRKFRMVALTVSVVMIAGGMFALRATAQEETSGERRTFTIGSVNDAVTFNPMFMIESPEYATADFIYDLFLSWEQDDMETTTNIATGWEQSEDGLTWTFDIRDDVTWHDGSAFTAGDIAATFNWIIDNGVGNFIDYLPFTESITAPDDTTLVWQTSIATSAPIYPPYIYILKADALAQYPDKAAFRTWKGFPDAIGTGPFRMVEWRRGDFWRLEANPDYWQGAPQFDELIFRVFQNEEAMIQALRQGEIDFADDIGPDLFGSLEGEPTITTNVGSPQYFAQLSFNQCTDDVVYCADTGYNHHPVTTDPAFRLAVEYAIDRQVLVDRVMLGYATAGATVIINPRWHHDPPNVVQHDPEEANRILDEAGYADTDGDGIREMPGGGEPLELRFIVRTEAPESINAGEFIAEWLQAIGVAVQTEAVTDSRLTDAWYANDWDMYMWGWGVEPDPNFQLSTYTTGQCGVWSDTCYSNPEYDQMFEDSQRAPSLEEREQLVADMQQMLYDDRPELVLWYYDYLQAYRSDRWTGFVPQPADQGIILFQYGHHSTLNIRPVTAEEPATGGDDGEQAAGDDTTEDGGGVPIAVWIGLAALVVVVGAILITRRRREEEEEA